MNAPLHGYEGRQHAARATRVHRRSHTKTGVVGISLAAKQRKHRPLRHYFVVAPHRAEFCVETLGRQEAWRRAIQVRAAHERSLAR